MKGVNMIWKWDSFNSLSEHLCSGLWEPHARPFPGLSSHYLFPGLLCLVLELALTLGAGLQGKHGLDGTVNRPKKPT